MQNRPLYEEQNEKKHLFRETVKNSSGDKNTPPVVVLRSEKWSNRSLCQMLWLGKIRSRTRVTHLGTLYIVYTFNGHQCVRE